MTIPRSQSWRQQGFTLIELMVSMAVMLVVLGAAFSYIGTATQRSQAESTKMDLTQQAREFVDEFERDLHQSGYPGCRVFNTNGTCSLTDNTKAVGLVYVSNYEVGFEGDVDGDGVVDTVWYRVVDSAGNFPPSGTCPCTIQRSQMAKVNGTPPPSQPQVFSQELQQVVNSGAPGMGSVSPSPSGGGLPIAGTTAWGASNTSVYAALTTVKDFPVFTPYDQYGNSYGPLPVDVITNGQAEMAKIKSIRLTINVLGSATTGYDLKTHVRPLVTLVGNARIGNCGVNPCN